MQKIKLFLAKIKYYRAVIILIILVSLIVALIMGAILRAGSNKYPDQTVARRWAKDGSFSHVSIFIKDTAYFTKESVDEFEYNLDNKLDYNSIEKNENGDKRYIISYMSKSSIYLESERKSVSVNCMAVGGDFFTFHPIKMVEGNYFSSSDLMHDGVILDKATAWQLFGSSNVVGQQILFGDRVLFVKGVYEGPDDKIYNFANGTEAMIFVPFELLDSEEVPLSITCLEVCMPNPIKNFASKLVDEIITIDESSYERIENSSRFSVENLWSIYKSRKYRSMQNRDIIYPYWEKIARYEEDLLAPKAVVMCVGYIVSGVLFITLILYEIAKHTKLKSTNDDLS